MSDAVEVNGMSEVAAIQWADVERILICAGTGTVLRV